MVRVTVDTVASSYQGNFRHPSFVFHEMQQTILQEQDDI
jgi:hypothetical protein